MKSKQDYSLKNFKPRYLKTNIPNDWKIVKLKEIVTFHNSGIFKNQEFYGQGDNIVGVSDLYNNSKIDGQIFSLVNLTKEERNEKVLEEGDLIYGESSLVRTGIAKTLYVTKKGSGTIFAWHTRRFKINKKGLPIFIYYELESSFLRKSLVSRSTTTALTGITTKEYFDTIIPLTSIKEQEKIASVLSKVDDLIDSFDKIIESTTRLKSGLMQQLLTKGIENKQFIQTKIGAIPKPWTYDSIKKFL